MEKKFVFENFSDYLRYQENEINEAESKSYLSLSEASEVIRSEEHTSELQSH